MAEEPYVIDTRQKYFHVPLDFLADTRPSRIQVLHPAYKTNHMGLSDVLRGHGYTSTLISPILDEYILAGTTPVVLREPYAPPHPPPPKVTKADVKNVLKKFGSPFENLYENIAYKIGGFLFVVFILWLSFKLLFRQKPTKIVVQTATTNTTGGTTTGTTGTTGTTDTPGTTGTPGTIDTPGPSI